MEKVFLISGEILSKGLLVGKESSDRPFISGEGIVDKALGPKRYLVTLADGTKITAMGPASLKKGTKVQTAPLSPFTLEKDEDYLKLSTRKGDRWSALVPLKFGNRVSEGKLEFYVEKEKAGFSPKKDSVIYLVFSIETETYGQIQWSIYLKGNRVSIQVYAEKNGVDQKDIARFIQDFEVSLKKKGFSLLAPTVILKRPFQVPTGFRLNIRG